MATKLRRTIEPKWVAWYVTKTWPEAPVRYRCPLGPIPEEFMKIYGRERAIRVYRPWRPEVDALVRWRRKLILLEAKIFKYMDGLSKLPVYKALIPETPELREYWDWTVDMILLIPTKIPWVIAAGRRTGVIVLVEAPEEVLKIWRERDKYWTREAIYKREKRKAFLRRHGFV